ncbi:MAG: hypothetical protein JO326_12445 [Acetobacteraceae bacterium]|nr:hypothetical protein [Acetobacteraceae bacterium]
MAAVTIGLGVDGGGSATRWALWGDEGRIAGGELPAVTGHLFHAPERARFAAMAQALGVALGDVPVAGVVAGITGLSATSPESEIAASDLARVAAVGRADVQVEDDIYIAFHAAFAPGEGHVVYAGTGSIGVHVRADGTAVRIGGRGMLIDDAGSAFWIGREALDLIHRALDANPAWRSPLADAVFAAIGGADWDRVRRYVYSGGRDAVAQLARTVAAVDDKTALDILRRAGCELARLAVALAQREGARPVALLGRAAGLHPAILTAMRERAAPLAVERRQVDAAAAAARLAHARTKCR